LCIEPGKQVFVVFVDVYVLNHDGNLIDASALAAVAALMNTKMANYEIKDGKVEIKQGYTPLPMKSHPITVTLGKINNKLIVDPWLEEEQVMDSRISMAFNDEGNLCAIQKGGSSSFTQQQIIEAMKLAHEKAAELRKKMDW
jgi:exosome complex component RRP42